MPSLQKENLSFSSTKKRFPIRLKLLLVFGFLIVFATILLGLISVNISRKAVVEEVETHLMDKATDTASVIDARIKSFWQFLEGIARMPSMRDSSISMVEKSTLLDEEARINEDILHLDIIDKNGIYT